MPIYHQIEQRSARWHRLRLGIPTASNFDRIVTPKGKLSSQAPAYMHRLLAELMVGRVIEDTPYQSEWMERGERLEEGARQAFTLITGVEVRPGGFVTVESGRYGCSPDGLTDDSGLELKIPKLLTHVGYMLDPASLLEGYAPQVQGCMMICERDTWHVCSYHDEVQPVIVKAKRDDKYITVLRDSLEAFCDTTVACRLKLEQTYGPFPEPKEFAPGAQCDTCPASYEVNLIGTPCQCGGLIVARDDPGALGAQMADLDWRGPDFEVTL